MKTRAKKLDLIRDSCAVEAFAVCFKRVDLVTLIQIKEAPGRAKDQEAIADLRVLLAERKTKQ